jgi:hypothetical protein
LSDRRERVPVEGARYLKLVVDRLAVGRLGAMPMRWRWWLRAQIEELEVGAIYREGQRRP